MTMPKILMFLAILACAAIVESKPTSDTEKSACAGCTPQEMVTREKRGAEDIIKSVSGLVGNILHENWYHIEKIKAIEHQKQNNNFAGNGYRNYY